MASTNPVQQSLKRKQSVAGITASGRNVKRRASKACHCCRSRKVRCDVVEGGIPCTNCRLDEVECLVTEGKRRRKSYVDGEIIHHHSPPTSVEGDKELQSLPLFNDIDELQNLSFSLNELDPEANLASLEEELHLHRPHMIYQTQGHRMNSQERSHRMSSMTLGSNAAPLPSPSLPTPLTGFFPPQSNSVEILLPNYLRPAPQTISGDDLAYLQLRGAFTIPDVGLRNELLRCYVQYVHPYSPHLDIEDFLASVEKNDPTDQLSLLLFQAVMFAGSGYIDMRYLTAQGYDTRKAARKALFQKVKLLYDNDYDTDRVTIVQAVLLMTYWYEAPDNSKDVWHWLGVATSLARTIGINCDTSKSGMDLKTRKLWKRIWWCCYMRDRLICCGMRRPFRIPTAEFELPILELDDFETEAMPFELSRMLGGCPVVKDSAKRVTLAKMCIGLARLCQCVTSFLEVQYTLMAPKLGLTHETTYRLVPRPTAADPSDVMRCDRMLQEWYDDQAPNMHFFVPGSHDLTNANDGEVISVHRGLLTAVYLMSVSAVHRPQIIPTLPTTVVAAELRDLSEQKVRQAADDLTELYKDLYMRDLIRYLPNTGVTCLLPSLVAHMLDLKSGDASVRQAASKKFQICMQSLQRFREMYASADFAFSFLDAAVRKTETNIGAVTASFKGDTNESAANEMFSTPMLTPPPEVVRSAKTLLFACSLAPEERKLLAALTPVDSDRSIGAVEVPAHDESDFAESPEEVEARQMEQQVMDDFEALINHEGAGDLRSSEKSVYAEMNMAWLNGMADEQSDNDMEMFNQHDQNSNVYEEAPAAAELEVALGGWE